MPESLAQIALSELAHRVAQGEAAIRVRPRTAAQVQALLRPWAAIAARVGADVRPLVVPLPGVTEAEPPCWLAFYPTTPAPTALRTIALESREAWHRLATRAEAARDPAHPEHERAAQLATRAAGLGRLEQHLTIAAGVPAWQPAHPEPVEGPESKSAEQVAA